MPYYFKKTKSPVGELTLVANEQKLVAILWESDNPKRVPLGPMSEKRRHKVLLEVEAQLKDYFSGRRRAFSLPIGFAGTEFQQKVWNALLSIPFGETRSYVQIARQIQHPNAYRAVGNANSKNPLSIVVPCHRVLTSDGKVAGFAGGLRAREILRQIEFDPSTFKK